MKLKKILGLLLISTLLWSCGSQFNRSKYDRYMWKRSSSNKNTVVEGETSQEKSHRSEHTASEKNNAPLAVLSEKDNSDNNQFTRRNDPDASKEVNNNLSSPVKKNKLTDSSVPKTINGLKKTIKNRPEFKSSNGFKSNSNSDLGNILMIILLVILIILLFSVLDSIFGGALTWILRIVILVVLIYFILKLLGLI